MHTFFGYLSVQGTEDDSMLAVSSLPSFLPYAFFTSLITVSSGETTGYVCVITTDSEAADWPYWMRTTVLESRNVDSNKYTPKVPYSSSFTATRTAKSSPLAPDVPTLSLTSSWERCDRASDHPLYM